MFNKLDMNFDLLLDQSELGALYLDKYETCMKPLFNSCDSFKDGKLSNNEWCYCFQKPQGEGGGEAAGWRVFLGNERGAVIWKKLKKMMLTFCFCGLGLPCQTEKSRIQTQSQRKALIGEWE